MKLYSNVSLIFITWLLLSLVIGFLSFNLVPHSDLFKNTSLGSFANWDGRHYLNIAEFGYGENSQYAFFPLYPLLIGLITRITQNYLLSGVLISVVCSFLGLQILYRLILNDFNRKIAGEVILYLLFFPTSFYFLTVYSEGLFFFLTIASFYFLRKRQLGWAVMFTSLASATRPAGVALVLVLLVSTHLTEGIGRKNYFVLLSPLGLILYCIFLYNRTGDPLFFITAESYWLRSLSLPVVPFWETIKSLSIFGFTNTNLMAFLDLAFAVFGVGFVIRSFRFLPLPYSVYTLASVGMPLVTASLLSMPRFLVVIFPIFILVSLIKNKYLILAYQMTSLMLLSLFIALFVNGYWVS